MSATMSSSCMLSTSPSTMDAEAAQQDLWSRITGNKLSSSHSRSSSRSAFEDLSSYHHARTPSKSALEDLSFQGLYLANVSASNQSSFPSVSNAVPRFASAQYGRTIHHPRLQQPTPDQEKMHLSMLAENRRSTHATEMVDGSMNETTMNSSILSEEEDLVKKLSKALSIGLPSSNNLNEMSMSNPNDEIHYSEYENHIDEAQFPSPTSTLCFPDSHNEPASYKNNGGHSRHNSGMPSFEPLTQDDNNFMGLCQLVGNKLETLQDMQGLAQNNVNEVNVTNNNVAVQKIPQDNIRMSFGSCRNAQVSKTSNTDAPCNPRDCCSGLEPHFPTHTFVICADTQLGITSQNKEWETELEYSRQAIQLVNSLEPRPLFVCVCGDLIDMEYTFEMNKGYPNPSFNMKRYCDEVQDQQNRDFQKVWNTLHPDIALVCLCGNHDVGNRPTPQSIQRYKDFFGDEYLAFWANGTYNIILNNVLFTNPSGAPEIFERQLEWLEERLEYASEHDAKMVFVFGHHPWFLYNEDEVVEDLTGSSAYPKEWMKSSNANVPGFPDAYFSVPKKYRTLALDLFRKHGVNAAFAGHFHQNLVSKARFGMDMIVTAPLSVVFESSGKPKQEEVNGRGVRVVEVRLNDNLSAGNATRTTSHNGGVRNGGTINHRFVPIGCLKSY